MNTFMNKAFLLFLSSAIVLLGARGPASAGVLDVTAISCPNALHVTDFNTCAKDAAQGNLRTGLYVTTNPSSPLSSLVRVTGTISGCDRKPNCRLIGVTTIPVKLNGDPISTDADLNVVDQGLFAQLRTTSELTRPIDVPKDYGVSYINNSALAEDTNSAINFVLYITRALNPNSVPVGTVVIVKWSDGTTAKFVKVSNNNSIQWAMVPGSARNAAGQPINPDGTPIANPHGGGDGGGTVNPITDPNYWTIYDTGGRNCSGLISIFDRINGSSIDMVFFYPC